MRHFAVLAAIIAVGFSSWAVAAPFDELADRLEQYDDQDVPRQMRTRSVDDDRAAPRPSRPRDRFASYPTEAVATPEPDAGPREYGEDSVWDDTCGGGGCLDGSCSLVGCGGCRRFWGRAEFIEWWVRGSNTPALVTTSPNGTAPDEAGILPEATILFGDGRLNGQGRSGGRFTLGYWLDACNSLGVENTFFFLGTSTNSYNNSSNGSPILARPFFNVHPTEGDPRQDSVLVAYSDIVTGNIGVTSTSTVYGNEFNLRRPLCVDGCRRVDLLAGYRFFQLAEKLRVDTNTVSIDEESRIPVGTTFNIFDSFNTRSQFNGGQIGLNTRYYGNCWSLDLLFKLAIGGVTQTVAIDGSTIITEPDSAPLTESGGILAQNTNIGQYNRTRFSVIPEFGVNLHRQIGPCWQVNVGYTLMVVTNVARPGDQIDTQLDPRQFPPPESLGPFTAPTFVFNDSDIWLQGVNVGLEYNF